MKEGRCPCLNKLETGILNCFNKNHTCHYYSGRWKMSFLFDICFSIKFLNLHFELMRCVSFDPRYAASFLKVRRGGGQTNQNLIYIFNSDKCLLRPLPFRMLHTWTVKDIGKFNIAFNSINRSALIFINSCILCNCTRPHPSGPSC